MVLVGVGPVGSGDARLDRRPADRPRPRQGALPAACGPLAHLARVSVGPRARRGRTGAPLRACGPGAGPPGAHADRLGAPAVRRGRPGAARRRPRTGPGPRGSAAAALQLVRRYTADTARRSILAVVEAECGDTDAALRCLAPLLESPYAAPIRWIEAWILSDGGRLDDAREQRWPASTARCPTTGCSSPLTTAAAPRRGRGRRPPLPPAPPARPCRRRRPVRVRRRGRVHARPGGAWPSPPPTSRSATRRPPVRTPSRRWRSRETMGAVLLDPEGRRLLDAPAAELSRSDSNRLPTAPRMLRAHGEPTRPHLLLRHPPGPARWPRPLPSTPCPP